MTTVSSFMSTFPTFEPDVALSRVSAVLMSTSRESVAELERRTSSTGGQPPLWFDDLDAIVAAGGTEEGRAAGAALLADERQFVDLERSPFFLTEEHVVVES